MVILPLQLVHSHGPRSGTRGDMTIEETLSAIVARELAPLVQQVQRLSAEVCQLRRAIPTQLVTMTAAAEALGLSFRTVQRRVKDGSIPTRKVGNKLLVDLLVVQHGPSEDEVDRVVSDILSRPRLKPRSGSTR